MTDQIKTQPLPSGGMGGATAPLGGSEAEVSLPTLKITKKLSLPDGISSNCKQHTVLVCDESSSMDGSKIDELNVAISGFVSELADPANKDGFLVSAVYFSSGAKIRATAKSAIGLSLPTAIANGGTNFDSALLKAIDVITDVAGRPNPEGWHYLRPQVLFLSDGHSNVSDKNIVALQEIADVTAIAYGSDASQDTLSRIANDGKVHVIGTSGSELRKFLAEVGKTLGLELPGIISKNNRVGNCKICKCWMCSRSEDITQLPETLWGYFSRRQKHSPDLTPHI